MLTSDSINGIMLHEHILISLRRVGLGVGAGVGLGVPLGLAISLSRIMRGILDPLIGLFRHVPPLTFLPLLVVWFGVGEPPIVAMLFLGALFVMAFATRAGATDIRQSKVYTAYSLGASKWQILRHVTLPHALPDIFTGARVAISLGWATLVAAELVGSDIGLGAMIWTGRAFNRNAVVVLGILTIGVVGVTIEVTMRRLERRLLAPARPVRSARQQIIRPGSRQPGSEPRRYVQ